MTPDEAARAAALHAAAFAGADRAWTAAEIAALAGVPGVIALLEPDAFLLGRVVAGEAELLTLAVAPDSRRRGAARRLLAAFHARAAALGAATAFLEVAEDNAAARSLYATSGWVLAGRRRGYYRRKDGAVIDALVMSRRLEAERTTPETPENPLKSD